MPAKNCHKLCIKSLCHTRILRRKKSSLIEREGAQHTIDYLFSCKTHAEKNIFNNIFLSKYSSIIEEKKKWAS